jgi:phage head maturation protease
MSDLIKKQISIKALDVDDKKKQVKVAISQLEDIDRDQDVFDASAYDKTIKENGPNGSNEIWHLLDHTPKSFSALSKFKEVGREGKYIFGVSQYKNSFAWREVAWPLYEAGDITQHSVGFKIVKADDRNSKGIRIIREVKLYEGSAVLWGAQPDTPTMRVVKSLMNIEEEADITAAEKIDQIIKQIKKGRYEADEDQSLLVIELTRLQYLFDTKQVSKIFEPDGESTQENTKETTKPDGESTLPVVTSGNLPSTVDCPSCNRFTENTQEAKGFIKCHRCDAVFVYGSKDFIKI